MSEVIDIFKTPLYFAELKLDNKKMASYCLSMSKKDKGRHLSNIGGWQSKNLKGAHKPLNQLFIEITKHIGIFNKTLQLNMSDKVGNIWININGYKDTNAPHIHPNCLISGVYYIQTPKDCGNIQFRHPNYNCFQYDWDGDEQQGIKFNQYNSNEWWFPSLAGRLYLFPSWLTHYVKPNGSKEKRISISFNSFD
tara:strand:+ start:899 stop:1480 length:582 start_codon:yes stop_codon:yes gene_type:complete